MSCLDLKRSRRARSEVALLHLAGGVSDWVAARNKADSRRQHVTQLKAIADLLGNLVTRLHKDFAALPISDATHAFFEAASRLDRRIVWVERIWSFFRTKFDQRNDPALAQTLTAADEMVWSCYREVFNRAPVLGIQVGAAMPAPLTFVEPRYAPEAFPAELVPAELKGEVEVEFLREYLNRMPISTVRIPPACAPAPWWLVLLAHEVGHHVQYDLLPNRKLVDDFGALLGEAAKRATGKEADETRWRGWSREIFADLFSVVCLGSWALRPILELELTSSENMHEPRDRYPSPATRLNLLARAADRLVGNSSGTKMLEQIPGLAEKDDVVEKVLDVALGTLPTLGVKLADLYSVDRLSFANDVDSWSRSFQSGHARVPDVSLGSAPILLSSAFDAWDAIAQARSGEKLKDEQKGLSDRCTAAIRSGAPGDERAGDASIAPDAALLERLGDEIWQETN
jgi:hypothetical protein